MAGRVGECAHNRMEFEGKKVGYLTVLRYVETRKKMPYWWARCDCGVEKEVSRNFLRHSKNPSCGCWTKMRKQTARLGQRQKNPKISAVEAALRYVLRSYVFNAKTRGVSWNLTDDYFRMITKQNCFYCDAPPSNQGRHQGRIGYEDAVYIYNGIDRLDNCRGYEPDNAVACCKMCNIGKNNHSLDDFAQWVRRCYEHIFKGKSP